MCRVTFIKQIMLYEICETGKNLDHLVSQDDRLRFCQWGLGERKGGRERERERGRETGGDRRERGRERRKERGKERGRERGHCGVSLEVIV